MKPFKARLMLFLSGALSVAVLSALTPIVSVAFWRLAFVGEFAFGAVGDAGTTSTGERLYHSVASAPLSPSAFRVLYRFGNPQAKAYALVGLREVDPSSYEKLLGDFRTSNITISWMAGCVITPVSSEEVADQIGRGRENIMLAEAFERLESQARD